MTADHETAHRHNMPIPPVLYKYYAFNEWTAAIFEQNEIYLQSPDGFNDPFDSKLSLTYEGTEDQRILRLVGILQEGRRRQNLPPKDEQAVRQQALDMVKRGQDSGWIQSMLRKSPEGLRKQMGIFCMTEKKGQHTHVVALRSGSHRILPGVLYRGSVLPKSGGSTTATCQLHT